MAEVPVQGEKINTLTTAAKVEIEPIWASLLAKALDGKDVKSMLTNVGGGGAPAAGVAVAAAGGGGGGGATDAAPEAAKEAEKDEAKEESDDDMVSSLVTFPRDSQVLKLALRASAYSTD